MKYLLSAIAVMAATTVNAATINPVDGNKFETTYSVKDFEIHVYSDRGQSSMLRLHATPVLTDEGEQVGNYPKLDTLHPVQWYGVADSGYTVNITASQLKVGDNRFNVCVDSTVSIGKGKNATARVCEAFSVIVK